LIIVILITHYESRPQSDAACKVVYFFNPKEWRKAVTVIGRFSAF